MIESFIKWMGGKSRLRKEIVPLIPPHKTYVEPFGGAAWVLFKGDIDQNGIPAAPGAAAQSGIPNTAARRNDNG